MTLVQLNSAFASQDEHGSQEKFNPGDMIMHHVTDAHEWHVMDIGGHPVSVPLPIILYTDNGLEFFMSSDFKGDHHGPREYNGYVLDHEHITAKDGSHVMDFSITKNVFAIFVSVTIMMFLFFSAAAGYKKNKGKAPKGIQSFLEPIIVFVRDDIAKSSIGPKYEKYMPYLLTLFFFIWINNLMGLIPIFPGGANVTGAISVCIVMATITFLITTFSANKYYWEHVLWTPGVPWWLKVPIPLMGIVEVLGVISKPIVLIIRLFANITAGHIIMLAFFSLIFIFGEMSSGLGFGVSILSVAFTIFMSVLELLVAFLQAYVFTLLSALYFGAAIEEHH